MRFSRTVGCSQRSETPGHAPRHLPFLRVPTPRLANTKTRRRTASDQKRNDVEAAFPRNDCIDVMYVSYICPDEFREPQANSAVERIQRDDLLFPDHGGL